MDRKGISELCAAVIRWAFDDYITSQKLIVSMSGRTGRNIEEYLAMFEYRVSKEYHDDKRSDGVNRRMMYKLEKAMVTSRDCEQFMLGQRFQMFAAGGITGELVKRKADEVVEMWAADQIKSTTLYLNKTGKKSYKETLA